MISLYDSSISRTYRDELPTEILQSAKKELPPQALGNCKGPISPILDSKRLINKPITNNNDQVQSRFFMVRHLKRLV